MSSLQPITPTNIPSLLEGMAIKSVRKNPERMGLLRPFLSQFGVDLQYEMGKIESGDNRTCRMLVQNNNPKAFFVIKDEPDNSCTKYKGIARSIQLIAFGLINVEKDSKKGLCSELLHHLVEQAKATTTDALHIKLDRKQSGLINFFKKNNFSMINPNDEKTAITLQMSLSRKREQKEEIDSSKPLQATLMDRRSLDATQQIPVSRKREREEEREPSRCRPGTTSDRNSTEFAQRSLSAPCKPLATQVTTHVTPSEKVLTARDYKDVTLKNPYVTMIQKGDKTIEGRINNGMFRMVKIGDRYRFFNSLCEVFCRVSDVKKYTSFPELLKQEGFKKCIPEAPNYEAACAVYARIPGYTERAKESGVLALHVVVEPKPPVSYSNIYPREQSFIRR